MKRAIWFRPLLMVGVLLLAILACMPGPVPTAAPPTAAPPSAASSTAEPPTAPPPTEAPTAAPTAQDFFTEGFDAETGQWSHFTVDATVMLTSPGSLASVVPGDSGNMSLKVADGHLVFDLEGKGLWVYATYDGADYSDVKMEAVADNRGTNDNNVSLICRYSKENGWYEFNVANSGLYDILYAKVTPDDKVTYSRIADGGSNKIKQGKQVNTYGMICKGHTLVLTINGYETRRIDDNQFVLDKGKVGISVSSFNSLPVNVLIDSVTISKP